MHWCNYGGRLEPTQPSIDGKKKKKRKERKSRTKDAVVYKDLQRCARNRFEESTSQEAAAASTDRHGK
ncbi:hypothetical protein TNCV_4424551 [Trichonephila clavipes]|nr:hypothetical protein TNCV_4424551 [Trichonephila clavipes]